MDINSVKIGIRIRNLRESKKYTREKFCELVGISSKFLYEIETGKKGFSAFVLCGIAEVCEVSCEYIMLGTEKNKSEWPNLFVAFEDSDKENIVSILQYILRIKANR